MKIFEVRVDLTRQLKQYESDKIGVSAVLEEGEDVHTAINALRDVCLGKLVQGLKGGDKVEVEVTTVDKNQVELPIQEPTPAKPKPKAKAKPEQVRVETPKVEEVKVEEVKVEVKAEPKVKVKAKEISYDRGSDLHKKHVGKLLDSLYSDWRKDVKKLEAAKKVSIAMEGRNFMDASGEIVDSFRKEFTSEMMNELSKS